MEITATACEDITFIPWIKLGTSQMCLLMGTVGLVSNVADGPIVQCFYYVPSIEDSLILSKTLTFAIPLKQ